MTSAHKANSSPKVAGNTECVKVALRCRPMNKKEQERGILIRLI